MTTKASLNKLLDSGKCLYFKLENYIYCLSKTNDKCQLSYWDYDNGWIENDIKDNTAINLIESDDVTCSLQQVYWWILENDPDGF